MKVMDEILRLKNKRAENVDTIDRLLKENMSITEELMRLEYGVYRGAIVVDKEGTRFQVVSLESYGLRPWVKAHPFKKDGTLSRTVRLLYNDWKLESDAG